MKTLACAALLLLGATATAQAERIQPFECHQLSGPSPSTQAELNSLPAFGLRKTGRVFLVCPFTESMTGFRVRFWDDDQYNGNAALKVHVNAYHFTDATSINRIDQPNQCAFSSNLTVSTAGVATIECGITADASTYQAFVVELWTRSRNFDVTFFGIETY